ncbi:hypothetical protein Pla110_24950 [Polystyrenella longa]|uniref:Mu-protocadherin-putative cell-suface protein n=1 Tax=Polystyrenella longa TaxID=2528007 RepID=A0A518CNF6_9PLAN|nr:protocadherin [Polystyrenella longa]QDU80762.1 hypothetical protein Pla110_24950 [Polystyrenella longa]
MLRKYLMTIVIASTMLALPLDDCFARGFGGGRGGFGGGGFGGERAGGGGFRGGLGGDRAGGGFNRGGFGGDRAGGDRFGGGNRPGNAGLGGNGFGGNRPDGNRLDGNRPDGNRLGGNGSGESRLGDGGLGNGRGADGQAGSRFNSPDKSKLGNFLGLPSDGGMNHLAGGNGNGGRGIAGRAGNGSRIGQENNIGSGNHIGEWGNNVTGNKVNVANQVGVGGGFNHVPTSTRYSDASAIRTNYNDVNIYGRGWYGAHPTAWRAAGWGAGYAWRDATWRSLGTWFAYPEYNAPLYYDYGDNVVYQGEDVYVSGKDVGTSEEYYNQASQLASDGSSDSESSSQGDWLPLGVFALSDSGAKSASATIQLAVNKEGILRGNYTKSDSKDSQVVHGSVDKKTQRAAFTVGDDQTDIYESGLYNFTKEQAPLLLHKGKDKTQQLLMVRLKKPAGGDDSSNDNQ